jgi:hypothetical protein
MDHLSNTPCEVVGFEVLTAVFINMCVFWDIIPHSPFNELYGIMSLHEVFQAGPVKVLIC